jgi:hypothetical protein
MNCLCIYRYEPAGRSGGRAEMKGLPDVPEMNDGGFDFGQD